MTISWAETRPAGDANKNWRGVASDSDGSNLIAADFGGRLWTSDDSGVSWTERRPVGDVNKDWLCVASDSDGSHLIAGIYGGRLYTSANSGVDWTERQPAGAVDINWFSGASDSDGSNLIVGASSGRLYVSIDSGANWTEERPAGDASKQWICVASNSDGSRLIAGAYADRLYITVSLPGKPTNPSPTDTASSITLDETPLSWDASNPAADTYEVYFRKSGDAWGLVGVAQAGVSWAVSFGTLAYGTTYEWRIDATNDAGPTTGDTWSFDTISFDQPRISYRLISGGNGRGPYDSPPGVQGTDWEYTGENNMLTVRKLVVAANDKIWHESI